MKRILGVLFSILFLSCGQAKSTIRLVEVFPFAGKTSDTEVLSFAGPRFEAGSSWSGLRSKGGGRYRWATTDRPRISWHRKFSGPAYLHLRSFAAESFSIEVRAGEKTIPVISVEQGQSVLNIPIPAQTTEVELKLPRPEIFGVQSAVVTRSSRVGEFRKAKEFASLESTYIKGKKRNAFVYETGGSLSFYERIPPSATIHTGYYFARAESQEIARFEVRAECNGERPYTVFEKHVSSNAYQTIQIPLRPEKETLCKLDFRIDRDVAFGKSKAAWIDPEIVYSREDNSQGFSRNLTQPPFFNKNILLIVLDAASYRRFGCYGYTRPTTPVIDAVASNGIVFDRAYTNAVYTLASTATLFTGRLPLKHGILHHRNKLPAEMITLAEVLHTSGYQTAAFLANGNASGAFGLTQGFETAREVFRDKDYVGWGSDITAAFSQWLNEKRQRKFFAYIHYREPHDPFNPPEEWVQKFTDPRYSGKIGKKPEDRVRIATNSIEFNQEDRKQISDLYDANLAYADHEVGNIIGMLKKMRLYEDTILVLTADHGEALWEHGYQGHNKQVYEESARVPMILKLPGPKQSQRRITFPVQHADLYPSLLGLVGVRTYASALDGFNFTPWLYQSDFPERSLLVHSTRKEPVAILLNDYKFIRNGDDQHELYHLKIDPKERNNLFGMDAVRAGYMNQILLQKLAAFENTKKKVDDADLDEAARENLKALGYVD